LGDRLVWFYIHAPLDVCMARDPKGLYKRAQAGQVPQLINYPFEIPRPPEAENYINTVEQNVEQCHQEILATAKRRLAACRL
jgi:adenylylsulfate kinase-like enzyme